ncbi:MAG TPA: TGS domain-containing protein, partial [Patescibacteria group bacterium]
ILVKFADQLHNLQTLEYLPKEKQDRFVKETLEIYAPIANRLRLGKIKGRLEDWAFKYANPQEFRWLNNLSMKLYAQREQALQHIKEDVRKMLEDENIEVISIHDRAKYLYSLYKKMLKYDLDITRIHDLVALRIIVPTIADCYSVLGLIHRKYRPLKGRIKDYIAQPKPNGYQSLHTTVFAEDGEVVEFQIRTEDMHLEAEYGLAAHWHFKEKGSFKVRKKLAWVNELGKMARQMEDERSLETLKIDIFQNRIFVFTPEGDVIELPEDATPVDFAYQIHTDIGNKCSRTKINDNPAGLDTKLKNGDVVEIIIDKKRKGPSLDWIKFVKTGNARSKIKHFNKKKLTEWEKTLSK